MRPIRALLPIVLLLVPALAAAQNNPPIADAGEDQTIFSGQLTTLNGTATDPDGDPIVSWSWAADSGPPDSFGTFSRRDVPDPAFSGSVAGDYVLSLVVSDGTDVSDADTVKISVLEAPTATPSVGPAPLMVQFAANASDPEGGPLTYAWDFGDPASGSDNTSTEEDPVHTYEQPGDYVATLTVSDGQTEVSASVPIAVSSDMLVTTEFQLTGAGADETTPRVGNDGVSDLVVYTSVDPTASGDVTYQRLATDGSPDGAPVPVASGPTNDRQNDVSGDYIFYTAFESAFSGTGIPVLYQISTGLVCPIGDPRAIKNTRIHGSNLAWIESGGAGGLGSPVSLLAFTPGSCPSVADAELVGNTILPTVDLDIGDRFVIWLEQFSGQTDIAVYDLSNPGPSDLITTTNDVSESSPTTSGPWVAWLAVDHGASVSRIEAINLTTGEFRRITEHPSINIGPRIDGDLLTWGSDRNGEGNYDVFLYRLSTEETFQVTTDPGNQFLNDVFGDVVAYVDDSRGTGFDIYVSKLEFVPPGGQPDIDVAPLSLDFGMVDVGSSSLGIVTVTNVGDADLTVQGVGLLPAGDPAFALVAPPTLPAVLAPDEVLDVTISFTPTSETIVEGALEVASNAPDSPLVTVDLVGEGVPFDDQVMRLLDEVFDPAVENGTLTGEGPGSSGAGRLGALRNMIEAAGDLIDAGFIDEACDQLLDAQKRCDGEFPPPDFVTGPSAPVLFDEIAQLRSNLGCDDVSGGSLRAAPDQRPTPRCGLGVELALLLPPLMWLHRRRLRL